jgi:LuxR family maltose regulon positive regulatory protein
MRRAIGSIIIDDVHRAAGDPEVRELLRGLIEGTRERNRWILASRESPKLPIAMWIAQGWMMLPITNEELAFRPDEAASLAREMGVSIEPDDLVGLLEDTGGWPLGLRVSLDLWSRRTSRTANRIRTHALLFDYVDTEVWSKLTPTDRELVYACSLLPSPSVALLQAAGYGDAAVRLDALCESLPFLRRNGDDEFVIHDLFRDYLNEQFRRLPDRATSVALDLARELSRAGRRSEALTLYVRAKDAERVREILGTDAFNLMETGHRPEVMRAVSMLAAADENDGVVLAIRGANALVEGSGENATALYNAALAGGLPASMRGRVGQRLAMLHFSRGKVAEGLEAIGPIRADETLSPDEQASAASVCAAGYTLAGRVSEADAMIAEVKSRLASVTPTTRARLLQHLGTTAYYRGDLEAAAAFSEDAVALAREVGLDSTAAWAYYTLYVIARGVDRDVKRALMYAQLQRESADRAGDMALRVSAVRSELGLLVETGNFEQAKLLDELLATLPDTRTQRDLLVVRIARSTLALAAGETRRAYAIMSSAPDAMLTSIERAFRDVYAALLAIVDGNRERAIEVAKRALLAEAAEDYFSQRRVATAHGLRALLLWSLDRPAQARRSAAFDISFLGERDRVLLEAMREIVQLPHPLPNREAVDGLCSRLKELDRHDYALLLRRLVDHDAAHVELTPAEIEILRAFDRHGGSAGQVAAALGKSRYTVQNQIQAAIKKIGCSGRAQALAYARQRGWLA